MRWTSSESFDHSSLVSAPSPNTLSQSRTIQFLQFQTLVTTPPLTSTITGGLRFRFMFHLLFNPVVLLNRPDFVGVGTACFVARHAIDRKHLALRALDSRFIFLDLRSDPLDLIPSDDVAAGVNSAVGFYPVKLIVAETTVRSIATPDRKSTRLNSSHRT